MNTTIFFTGGGTAGHVFPGLAVAEEIRKTWHGKIVWVGSKKGMERRFARQSGLEYESIPTGKMRRYFSLRNILDIFKILFGVIKSYRLCNRYKPVLVFSKGGYVSVPLVFAAGRKGIPVITHESDTDPGLATKLNARTAAKICIAFEETKKYFEPSMQEKLVVTGNPVRKGISGGSAERGRKLLGIPADKKMIFVLGGSQGARQINDLIRKVLPDLESKYFILHQMGPALYVPSRDPLYRTVDFIGEEMPDFLAAADLVVCRAGANTLAEISLLGKPAILIPLMGGAGRGDQVKNARLFKQYRAVEVLEGEEAVPEALKERIISIMEDREKRAELSKRIAALAHLDAAAKAAGVIRQLLGGA